MKNFLIAFFVTYGIGSLFGFIFLSGSPAKEFGYELGHYIRTGQSIEVKYFEFYIVESEEDLIIK